MLKFTDLNQDILIKDYQKIEKKTFEKSMIISLKIAQKNSLADALNVAFHIAQSTVHFITIYLIGLKLAAEDRLEEAYEISSSTNNMPEICGRICPQDRLCEGNCVIEQSGHGSVTIGSVEKYLTDNAFENGWITLSRLKEHRKRK